MMGIKSRFAFAAVLTVAVFLSVSLSVMVPSTLAQSSSQRTFSSADGALQALVSAAVAKDRSALARLFGPDYDQLLSGDDVEDAKDLNEFAESRRFPVHRHHWQRQLAHAHSARA